MSYNNNGARVRARLNLSSTIKEGWRYETTVEVEMPFDTDTDVALLQERVEKANAVLRSEGMAEVNRRSILDDRPAPYGV